MAHRGCVDPGMRQGIRIGHLTVFEWRSFLVNSFLISV